MSVAEFLRAYDLLRALGELEGEPVSDIALKALSLEDRPDGDARVKDPDRIAAILKL